MLNCVFNDPGEEELVFPRGHLGENVVNKEIDSDVECELLNIVDVGPLLVGDAGNSGKLGVEHAQ